MTLREADLQPGDTLDIRRTGLTVKSIEGDNIRMTNQILYGLDKEHFTAENVVRKGTVEFWPPEEGDIWEAKVGAQYHFIQGVFYLPEPGYKNTTFGIGEMVPEALKLVFRQGVTDPDMEAMTQRVIKLSETVVEQMDALVVAKSVANDARKEADAYLVRVHDLEKDVRALEDQVDDLGDENQELETAFADLQDVNRQLMNLTNKAEEAAKKVNGKRIQFKLYYQDYSYGCDETVWMETVEKEGMPQPKLSGLSPVTGIEFRFVDEFHPYGKQ